MAVIENAAASPEALAEWRASMRGMDRAELMAQQLVQRGAEHAIAALQRLGPTTENCAAMLVSIREALIEVHTVAAERGIELIGYAPPPTTDAAPAKSTTPAADPEPCYSLDEESFNYQAVADVLQALDDQGTLVEGATFYEGETVRHAPSHYFDVNSLLEGMGERAYDDVSEHADAFPDLTKEKAKELQAMIGTWLDANVDVNFYMAVNTRTVKVTAEMIAEHRGAPEAASQEGAQE